MMPPAYYTLQVPRMIAATRRARSRSSAGPTSTTSPTTRPNQSDLIGLFRTMVNHLFPVTRSAADTSAAGWDEEAERIRRENGFDPVQHEQLREDLQRGRIGLARNRLSVDLDIRDVDDSELIAARGPWPSRRGPPGRGGDRGTARSPS